MEPTGGESGCYNADLTTDVNVWNRQAKQGVVFDSSTGFKLPGGADRSPDVAWVELQRWLALPAEQRKKFPPLAPDFVIELRSETDALKPLQAKMQEYLDNGVRLGWLIDPQNRQVEIYRHDRRSETVQLPATLSGEDVLEGFSLQLD
jgi:Uma2 family endonuclease